MEGGGEEERKEERRKKDVSAFVDGAVHASGTCVTARCNIVDDEGGDGAGEPKRAREIKRNGQRTSRVVVCRCLDELLHNAAVGNGAGRECSIVLCKCPRGLRHEHSHNRF